MLLSSTVLDVMPGPQPLAEKMFTALSEREAESWVLDTYEQRIASHHDRKSREKRLTDVIENKWPVRYVNGKTIVMEPVVENKAVSGIEGTSKLAGASYPTLRVEAPTEAGTGKAKQREQVIAYYWQLSRLRVQLPSIFRDLAAKGLAVIRIMPDFDVPVEDRFPKFERLNPSGVIPPPGWESGCDPQDVLCTTVVKSRYFRKKFPYAWARMNNGVDKPDQLADVEIVYYYSDEIIAAAARCSGGKAAMYAYENSIGRNPVILIGRDSADSEIRGQFDYMINPMLFENRLATQMADYVDQAVYAVPWKKKVQTPLKYGPEEFWDLGEDGEVGRLGPPQIDPSVWRALGESERWSRHSGHVPESREGIIQNFGSASYVEASQGALTTIVANLQTSVADGLERASEVAQIVDRVYCSPGDGRTKSILGYAQGGQFRLSYNPEELFGGKNISCVVSYGAGSGLNEFNKIIQIIQLLGSGLVSKRWAMENIPGIENVMREEGRMFNEAILQMLIQVALSKAAQGDDSALRGLVELESKNENLLEVAKQVLENTPPTPPVQPGVPNAAAQATQLQKGGIPSAPGQALPPLTSIRIQ